MLTYQIQTWPFSWTRQFTSCNHETRCDTRWNYSERDFSTLVIGNMTRLSQWKDCTEQHISFQTKTIIMACQIWTRTYHLWTSLVKWKKVPKVPATAASCIIGRIPCTFCAREHASPELRGERWQRAIWRQGESEILKKQAWFIIINYQVGLLL